MVCYLDGKIYKLVNLINDEIYIGSTCNYLRVRKQQHKCGIGKCKKNLYRKLREMKVKKNDIDLILIEDYPCENRFELHKRERYWIEKLNAKLNNDIPTGTIKEWYKKNENKIKVKRKNYYEENKIGILNHNKKYRELNKDKIKKRKNRNFICLCGSKVKMCVRARHFRTKRHHDKLIRLIGI